MARGDSDRKSLVGIKGEMHQLNENQSSDEEMPERNPRGSTRGRKAPQAVNWKRVIDEEVDQSIPGALRLCISNAKKQKQDVLKEIIEGVTSVRNIAGLVKQYSTEQQLENLGELTSDFVRAQDQLNKYDKVLSNLENSISASRIPPTFEGSLQLTGPQITPEAIAKHDYMKQFYAAAGIEREDDDEEVMVQETSSLRNTFCPITQMEMEEPVRNPACGHTYSKRGIEAYLKRKTGCPVAGCRKQVANLERDVEMEVLISSSARNRERNTLMPNSIGSDGEEEIEYVVE